MREFKVGDIVVVVAPEYASGYVKGDTGVVDSICSAGLMVLFPGVPSPRSVYFREVEVVIVPTPTPRVVTKGSIKVGDKVVANDSCTWKTGTIATFIQDDGTSCVRFRNDETGHTRFEYYTDFNHIDTPLTTLAQAEAILAEAQAKVDELKEAERVAAEAAKKAEEDALKFTEADLKVPFLVVKFPAGGNSLRFVLVINSQFFLIDNYGREQQTRSSKRDFLETLNAHYTKTTLTLKDFAANV